MDIGEIVNSYYREAAKGLNEAILNDGDLWYSHVLYLPEHLQVIYTIGIFVQQVNNGGLHQYFFNGYGQFAYLTIDNLKLIEALRSANILERALDQVNEDHYSIDEFRRKVYSRQLDSIVNFVDELCDFLEKLDDEYSSLDQDEDLATLYCDYLKKRDLFDTSTSR